MPKRHETILRCDEAILVVVDFQERMVNALPRAESVKSELLKLIHAMKRLDVPIIATEQYPKGLGPTVEEIAQELDPALVAQKMTFSCCGVGEFWDLLEKQKRRQVIVAGVEAHVCVLQTVLDLLANQYQVHVPIGAVCSRADANRDNALERIKMAGGILTNTETVLFELMVEAGTDVFKAVRQYIV